MQEKKVAVPVLPDKVRSQGMMTTKGMLFFLLGAVVLLAVLALILFQRSFMTNNQAPVSQVAQELSEKKDLGEDDLVSLFFKSAGSGQVRDKKYESFRLTAGYKVFVEESGTTVGFRLVGEVGEIGIPVIWVNVKGVWTPTVLTAMPGNPPWSYAFVHWPGNVSDVDRVEFRFEKSGFSDSQPEGELVWDIAELWSGEGTK